MSEGVYTFGNKLVVQTLLSQKYTFGKSGSANASVCTFGACGIADAQSGGYRGVRITVW